MIDRQASSTLLGRLYTQSYKITNQVLKQFEPDNLDLSSTLNSINVHPGAIFDEISELESLSLLIYKRLTELASHLDPMYCIPVLIEIFSGLYGQDEKYEGNTAFVGSKVLISFIWTGTYSGNLGRSRSYKDIVEGIKMAMLFLKIEQAKNVWKLVGEGQVEIREDGVFATESLAIHIHHFNRLGPNEYKVLKDATDQLWFHPENIYKVEKILTGKVRNGDRLFGDTFLSEIPFTETNFWTALYCKLRIYIIIGKERSLVAGKQLTGLCLLTEKALLINEKSGNFLNLANQLNFWEPTWHNNAINGTPNEIKRMIIHRPVIGVYNPQSVFATSIPLLWDSVNFLLEDFVHSRAGNKIYERFFSGPFEKATINLFEQYGFKGGEVNDKSIWRTKIPEKLLSPDRIPGQIDILAVSEEYHVIVIADCKMVHFPFELNAARNILAKFGSADDERFFRKLNMKTDWLSTCSNFKLEEYVVVKMLITNLDIPLSKDEDRLVLSIREVEEKLLKKLKKSGDDY
ncbi:hypothetical protein SAMN05192574_12168 [Mucilaginibacter gossypiicola]|uniref:Uncharacterized protein n=1 Tax=Mucilaginibacter gossypiicola TaxID=551995 RepID=A0A1H8V0X3_9SPHI|nr:hypothetical protein [Mucilaginibacter gossypiicola]SEP08883.1 hypothetical protein SAMN05192574_12168 [Mucilaginibacter gossypiicola]